LENVATVDALTTGVSMALIVSVGAAAAFLPALRIRQVDPAAVLRS
jgi:ABC-type antimicrobial peptide transport system permease subunit